MWDFLEYELDRNFMVCAAVPEAWTAFIPSEEPGIVHVVLSCPAF